MKYIKRGESISLVVLCNVTPIFIHLKWMNEREIITAQEYDIAKGRPFSLGADASISLALASAYSASDT